MRFSSEYCSLDTHSYELYLTKFCLLHVMPLPKLHGWYTNILSYENIANLHHSHQLVPGAAGFKASNPNPAPTSLTRSAKFLS